MTFRKAARDPLKLLVVIGRLIDWARSFSDPFAGYGHYHDGRSLDGVNDPDSRL